jgi:hypothetical protein
MPSDSLPPRGWRPSSDLLDALAALGPEGARTGEMLAAAAEQADQGGLRAGNLVVYCIREALTSVLDLGGRRTQDMTDAARQVVETANRLRSERGSSETLLEAITALEAALEGPGPHARRLESVITTLARRAPARAEADLLDRYVEILSAVSGALHGDIDIERARELLARALVAIGRLFGPMTGRLSELDELVAITGPTPSDVATLAGFVGDPRVIAYFFAHVTGPGWLRALRGNDLLRPPVDGFWAARPYLARLAESHPDEVRDWMASSPPGHQLDPRQAADLLSIARLVKSGVGPTAVRIADTHFGNVAVLHAVAAYLDDMPVEEHAASTVLELLKRALNEVLDVDGRSGDSYLAAGMLRIGISSAREQDPERWLRVLSAKLASIAAAAADYRVRQLPKIDELELDAGASGLELLTVAVRDVARIAADQGVLTNKRLHSLSKIPHPLRGRLMAAHLAEALDADADAALELLKEEVAERAPMPETLALLRALRDRATHGLEDAMGGALGEPPPARETADFKDGDELPGAWTRAYGWLDAMPHPIAQAWAAADERVAAAYGPASPQGHLLLRSRADWIPRQSPLGAESLLQLTPIEAAREVAGWRADTGDFLGARARGLAETLSQVIERSPEPWLSEDPMRLIPQLRHPTYIAAYLDAVATHADRLQEIARGLIDAVELVQSKPWSVEDLGGDDYDYDHTWANAIDKGIHLLGELAAAGVDVSDRDKTAWDVIERAIRDRGADPQVFADEENTKALDRAINRPSMRALEVAFTVAAAQMNKGEKPQRLLDLLDEALGLESPDGLHARAIIAPRLPWLASRAPDWTNSRWDLLVGDAAPNGLGAATFDLYLKWGNPYAPLLEKHRALYQTALARVPEQARDHILAGLVHRAAGYKSDAVLGMLSDEGPASVSEAGQWLGFNAYHALDMPLDAALEFWEAANSAALPAEAYEGFGWFSLVERLDGQRWLDLTFRSAQRASGQLDQAARVAERALEHANDERAIKIVTGLLAADLKLWYLEAIGQVGLKMLRHDNPDTAAARAELRERLLEREFFDAR